MRRMKTLEWMLSAYSVLLLATTIFNKSVFCAVNPEAYVNRTHGFSINPPSGWTVDESGAFGTVVIFYGPVMPETGGKININIVAGTTNLTLDQYVSAGKLQLASSLTNYHLVSEGSRNIGGLDGYELVGTFTQGAFNFKNKQVIFVERGRGYIITFTALPTNYDNYLPTLEESLQTFKLLGPEFPWDAIRNISIGAIVGASAIAGIGIFIKRREKTRQQRIASEMLEVLKLYGSIKSDDLAKRLTTKEADIELAVIRLKKEGVPVSFNRQTREAIYEKQE